MTAYIIRRLLATIPVLVVVAVVVFSILYLAPGDPAAIIAGDQATIEQVEQIRQTLGLDRPFLEQFATWLGDIVRGDFGDSIFSNRPVIDLFMQRIEPTIALTVSTTIVTILLAVPLGVLAAWKAGSWIDRAVMSFAVVGFSFPVFVIGYILIYIFAITFKILPVQGYRSIEDGLWPFIIHLILPSLALAMSFMALVARITRASVLEVLSQDHIRTARSKGLTTNKLLFRHALPNAAVPIVTIIGVGIAILLGGVVVTESVFAIPGVGRLVVDAILARDYPIIQGVLLIFSAVYVALNLILDILYTFLDPRIRY
ncbi:ABC transporter permease [Pikeienuella piscinae]|uniref:ABC transporter permease n=1 Tax=Pikeienuella piscinae TaxID=2748098 RepID=A0A7L5BZ37_9RHOB|nr:ABC transporter permease [Pikeienuella piscinae]QIE56741.1 ABC transporter permease [Pikeienuella piscinae]